MAVEVEGDGEGLLLHSRGWEAEIDESVFLLLIALFVSGRNAL